MTNADLLIVICKRNGWGVDIDFRVGTVVLFFDRKRKFFKTIGAALTFAQKPGC